MISDLTIHPSSTIHSLNFLLDFFFSKPQFLSVAFFCFYHLRCIRQSSSYLDDAFLKFLVCFLVFSRLNNETLYTIIFLEAFNPAARLVSHTPDFFHILPSFIDFHWLPLHFRFSKSVLSCIKSFTQ